MRATVQKKTVCTVMARLCNVNWKSKKNNEKTQEKWGFHAIPTGPFVNDSGRARVEESAKISTNICHGTRYILKGPSLAVPRDDR